MTHKYTFATITATSLFWIAVAAALLVLSVSRVEAFARFPTSNSRSAETTLSSPNVLSRRKSLSLSQEDSDDGLDGASDFELFAPRLLDGIAFNLFGLGRKDDEDASTGAFQPPKDSMTGIVVVITGAASGLGLESAKRLALAGATVIVTGRTPSRTAEAVQAVRNYCLGGPGNPTGAFVNRTPIVRGITLDLADLSSVRSFPERYRQSMLSLSKISNRDEQAGKILGNPKTATQKIHVLINNACGGSVAKRELTMDGIEMIFQTGYLGHFVLTARLFEEGLLNDEIVTETNEGNNKGSGCTIISVSSSAHRSSVIYTGDDSEDGQLPTYGFDFENLNSDLEFSLNTYSRTKLANVMFTKELQRRANNSTGWLTAVSVDPGVSSTNIWKNSVPAEATWKDTILPNLLVQFMTKVDRGANAHVWLAYASSANSTSVLTSGQHYDETRNPAPNSRFANDPGSNRKLWELSEEMGGIRFDLGTTPMESTSNKEK